MAQNLLPSVYNYTLSEYQGASKNWGLAVNSRGELFAANNKGLLHYDGEKWTLNKLPNNTIIRSVKIVGDRVFTGSYEEFGYWTKDDLGILKYTSLTHLIEGHEFTSEEFWEIIVFGEQVIFRSFSTIYIYQNNKIKVIDLPQIISDLVIHNSSIIVAAGTEGLFELKSEKLIPLMNQDELLNKNLTDMVSLGNQLLIGTKLDGCYLMDHQGTIVWDTPLNQELKRHQLNKILKFGDNQLAFGTIKNGVYLWDTAAETSKLLNREAGLLNNTVLSMLQFQDQLWMGLDNGLARAKLNNPITYFTDFSGSLGMVYDIALFNNRLYLGSNTGVFYFENDKLRFVEGSQGHVWDLELINGDLLCGHNTGTYRIVNNKFEKVSDFSGGYAFARIPQQQSTYVQGTYNGLVRYNMDAQGNWEVVKIANFDDPIKHLCFETPNVLWAAHPYKGFYRIQLDNSHENVVSITQYEDQQEPSAYNVKLYNIKNQIVIRGENSWYKYDPILDRIVTFEEFQKFNDQELLSFDKEHFWFVNREGKKEIIHTDLKKDSLTISDFSLNERLAPDSQNIIKVNDSVSYITLTDGFAMVNTNIIDGWLDNMKLPIPHIQLLRDEGTSHPGTGQNIEIPYKDAQVIALQISASELMQPRYRYELLGPTRYSEIIEEGFVQFQNLPHGDYTFNVYTVGQDNQTSLPSSLNFQIAPPWYLSKLSLLLYSLLGIGIVFMVRFYNKRKFKRKQLQLEATLKKEQEEQLAVLEKEKLAREIKLKQNELASTTLNIAKKNEMILEFKNMLVLNKDKFSNSQRYRSFLKKLNNSIKDNDDWKRFEVNFKELHEDFFERLLKAYPNLTPKDLKLCAYLKMNLSTKEIAPLMAISVRGVEIHRYRLRKKLEIDSSKSLSNFLITF